MQDGCHFFSDCFFLKESSASTIAEIGTPGIVSCQIINWSPWRVPRVR